MNVHENMANRGVIDFFFFFFFKHIWKDEGDRSLGQAEPTDADRIVQGEHASSHA